jgi:hypothetical protein
MLGIDLGMAVALHDVISARCGILGPLRESIESHLYPSFLRPFLAGRLAAKETGIAETAGGLPPICP